MKSDPKGNVVLAEQRVVKLRDELAPHIELESKHESDVLHLPVHRVHVAQHIVHHALNKLLGEAQALPNVLLRDLKHHLLHDLLHLAQILAHRPRQVLRQHRPEMEQVGERVVVRVEIPKQQARKLLQLAHKRLQHRLGRESQVHHHLLVASIAQSPL